MIEQEKVLWAVCQEMTKNLKANAVKLGDKAEEELNKLIEVPGIFGVFYDGKELGVGLGKSDDMELVYVSGTQDFGRHMLDDCTGCSSLRRSLAALLAGTHDLHSKPRSEHDEDVDRFDNYGLVEASEAALSAWMKDNLYFSSVSVPEGDEEKFIQAMVDCNAPVFNLRNNKGNQYCSQVKHFRKLLSEEAKGYKG